ncbi:Carbamoyl-phosphate synthase large chain [Thermogutta terrifontis]|uniref:Carbamoyl phosphate synthase large chain n=1 Tax=Thermogutta terrifontis TaxID=1331910 RepID=A0A286RD57_9BACT|nr:carbamoyl-phosphate synthase large subunit [Thermogutta terrifontis]ASV73898.1 Carbamoyl-phosphate synthase large chain [Thermogutta terrifontis]
MPRRNDIHKILLIGSGPIVIGQACEFDYSGSQACKALREEGYEVVLINSNPATIMTDPEMAHRTYIEPITWEFVAKVIEKERPDALLPTLGGQTGLNVAMDLYRHGILDQYKVEMIGANAEAIAKAEERDRFRLAMERIGLDVCRGRTVHNLEEAQEVLKEIGLPCVVRPSFTLGGTGSSVAFNREQFLDLVTRGLTASPIHEVLLEESVLGWKEFELEVMRDADDNVVIICSIENLDPMGIHTGDSITVAPVQTLTDKEYQRMRDAAIAVIREIGVDTGGSNIQFAVNPKTGRMVVIEMNPRVSRSSALASKATGFPIAKIAAKLAVGYRLHELANDITRLTKACFEPTIDYVVTKIPRFAFEKFPEADPTLTTQMKSVGETMAIGRTFKESLQKALRGLEVGAFGLGCDGKDLWGTPQQPTLDEIRYKLAHPNAQRIWYIRYAFKAGMSVEEVNELTSIDPWFLHNIKEIVDLENELRGYRDISEVSTPKLRQAKQYGFSDRQLAVIWNRTEMEIREERKRRGIVATFKAVDTCAAEFEAYTPYYYSTYEEEDETPPKKPGKKRIMILGGGPNRIGQGIEFDYCCCHASFALRELGIESVMVNSNPETVSTDYDTSDLLFFEPLTCEDILNIQDRVQADGVIVQFGGQTPLNLARALQVAGLPIIGTSVDTIEDAEDREKFADVLRRLNLRQPPNAIARTLPEAQLAVQKVGFPVLVRPSFVLGGRAMEICYDMEQFERFVKEAFEAAEGQPVLIDRFLEDATEVDVDAIADGETVVVAGVMEHIEEAGVHSGDSACAIPPYSLPGPVVEEIRQATCLMAKDLQVKGLMNVQFAVKREDGRPVVYVLEVNPRASRTVPFVSKAVGWPLAKSAAKVMVGVSLKEQGWTRAPIPNRVSVKEAVLPFVKFFGVDIVLGPEMKSTGEVMGVSRYFSIAYAKSQIAAGTALPRSGRIFISVADRNKHQIVHLAQRLQSMGYELLATKGTADRLEQAGVKVIRLKKIKEGHPNVVDYILNGDIQLIINTPSGKGARTDEGQIRALAIAQGIPCITTISAAEAAVKAMEAMQENAEFDVEAVQDRFPNYGKPGAY